MSIGPEERARLVREVGVFEHVEPADVDALAAIATEVEFPAGRLIARQGEMGNGLFVIASGHVDVIRDGERLATLVPGEWFGELAVLARAPRVASCVASEPTTCLAIAAWDIEQLLLARPALAIAMLRSLAIRMRELTEDHRH
ncbi:MAG TPA: cyclic nucleotide-binding domain-containing protein [Candidatus Dormibacteraeota bacterium]|nr:cyclic nucleotide-binding domain-containing protein [Candidatus Dormibacteraeota bacterium]